MAEYSGFFPDVDGDREYNTDFLAQWIASIIGNGVYNGTLAVTAGDHMQAVLPAGKAWINGYHYRNDGNLPLAIANADGILNRKDTVVLRWDVNERSITAQVLTGTPASSPTAPGIIRTSEQYDLKLAEISIPAGTTAITGALITDTRLDNSVCGIVHGVVSQVDTTTLYNQIQADLQHFQMVYEADFTAWVTWLKEILDSEAAGNLLNVIQTHEADAVAHVTQADHDKISGAVQSATLGGAAVPKSETTLQLPAYPVIPSSLPANGGTADYAHYSSHAVGSGGAALRNITMSTAGPSGGQDGDVWHQYS
nr:MAG TPA: Receptor Binding Protein [Caudoviricetes sp.]